MVAVAQYIPNDPGERESVLAVLREHPELREVIGRAIEQADSMFPDLSVTIDSTRYEDDDPPVRVLLRVVQPWDDFRVSRDEFVKWLVQQAEFDSERILIMPMWGGPVESYTG